MERNYAVGLDLRGPISLSRSNHLMGYLRSSGLFVPEETLKQGLSVHTRTQDNVSIVFGEYAANFQQPGKTLEELEAVRCAIAVAAQLESITPPFEPQLKFNPNLVYIYVGTDSQGNKMLREDFMRNARRLQRALYSGGNFAYTELSGDFGILLGLKEDREGYTPKKEVRMNGAANPASSLDELLARIKQSKSSQ